jgi:hypothetical protein
MILLFFMNYKIGLFLTDRCETYIQNVSCKYGTKDIEVERNAWILSELSRKVCTAACT